MRETAFLHGELESAGEDEDDLSHCGWFPEAWTPITAPPVGQLAQWQVVGLRLGRLAISHAVPAALRRLVWGDAAPAGECRPGLRGTSAILFHLTEDLEWGLDVTSPRFNAFTDGEGCDDECGDRVGPPPTEQDVQNQTDEHGAG